MQARQSHSLQDTAAIAGALARELRAGDCVALEGPMGAGKTTFVRALIGALGGNERDVSSPTFALLNVYPTPRFKVFHLDAYRVGGEDDFEAIGFTELLEQPDGLVIVEWPSRVGGLIPRDAVRILIDIVDEQARSIAWARGDVTR